MEKEGGKERGEKRNVRTVINGMEVEKEMWRGGDGGDDDDMAVEGGWNGWKTRKKKKGKGHKERQTMKIKEKNGKR